MNEAAKTTEIDSFMRERSFRCMQLVKTFNKMYEWLLDEISMTLNKIWSNTFETEVFVDAGSVKIDP